jgi:hypothetical protein
MKNIDRILIKKCLDCPTKIQEHNKRCLPCSWKAATRPVEERFFSYVTKTETCWFWTSSKDHQGHGIFHLTHPRKNISAHRQSWIIHKGPIPEKMCVCHKCDIRHCVNPDHLFLGTFQENTDDMLKKRRGNAWGHAQKLTPEDVRRIRSIYVPKKYTLKMLAKEYNCHLGTIYDAIHRRWKHI